MIVFPPVILRDAEHLLQYHLFFIKDLRKFTCCNWLLGWLCLESIYAIHSPGPFLRAAVISSPIGLVNGGTSKHRCTSCSYRKCPQGGSTSSCPIPTRTLRSAGLLGCELEWNVPEQILKGLCLTTSKLLPSPGDSSQPWPQTQVRGPGGCSPRKDP